MIPAELLARACLEAAALFDAEPERWCQRRPFWPGDPWTAEQVDAQGAIDLWLRWTGVAPSFGWSGAVDQLHRRRYGHSLAFFNDQRALDASHVARRLRSLAFRLSYLDHVSSVMSEFDLTPLKEAA